jgi:hypothetical protein
MSSRAAVVGSMRQRRMARGRHSTTASSAGRPRAYGAISSMHFAGADGPPAQLLIDSSAVRAHRCAAGGTYQIAVLNILQGNVRYSGGHCDPGKCNRLVRSRGQLAPRQARQLRRRSGHWSVRHSADMPRSGQRRPTGTLRRAGHFPSVSDSVHRTSLA